MEEYRDPLDHDRKVKRFRHDVNHGSHQGIPQLLMNYIQIKHLETAAYATKYLELKTFSPTTILKIIPVSKRPNIVGRYINKGKFRREDLTFSLFIQVTSTRSVKPVTGCDAIHH